MSNDISDLFAQLQTTTIEDKPTETPIRKKYKYAAAEPYKRDINLSLKEDKPADVILDSALQCISIATDDPLFYEQNKKCTRTENVLKDEVSVYFEPFIHLVRKIATQGQTLEDKSTLLVYNNIFSEYDKKLEKYGLKGWIANELERLEKE